MGQKWTSKAASEDELVTVTLCISNILWSCVISTGISLHPVHSQENASSEFLSWDLPLPWALRDPEFLPWTHLFLPWPVLTSLPIRSLSGWAAPSWQVPGLIHILSAENSTVYAWNTIGGEAASTCLNTLKSSY